MWGMTIECHIYFEILNPDPPVKSCNSFLGKQLLSNVEYFDYLLSTEMLFRNSKLLAQLGGLMCRVH